MARGGVDGALSAAEALGHARRALAGTGPPVVAVTAVGPEALAGARMCVWADRHAGTLGDRALDEAAVRAARAALAEGTRPGVATLEAGALTAEVYLEPHHPPPSLVIVGAGHVARPLCHLGALLGFRVTVLDDRPDFATHERFPEAAEVRRADFSDPLRDVETGPRTWLVLVTRGHKYDFEALREVLRRPALPAYVGMIGSRRRTRAALQALASDGVPAERLAAVHAPLGLDVGAETPEEIAVAVAAELVLVRRGGSGRPLREVERVAERWVRQEERGRR